MMKKSSSSAPGRARGTHAQQYTDMFSDYVCQHDNCDDAPDPAMYPYESDMVKWRRTHINSVLKHIHTCLPSQCCTYCQEPWQIHALVKHLQV